MILFYLGGIILLPMSLFSLMTLVEEPTIIDIIPGALGVVVGLVLTICLIMYLYSEYAPEINISCKCDK